MQDYRLYFLGADGHIQAASDLKSLGKSIYGK